jgi:UDPglucose 6-dehydrogenase
MRVSVVGLGRLGSPLAAVLASRGHRVIGVDVRPDTVGQLRQGRAPVVEPRLQELIDSCRDHLSATTDFVEAVLGSQVTFVIVPTPSDASGAFSNEHVLGAIREVAMALRKKSEYHVVSVTSTVMPGSTGGEIREALERVSGRRVGRDVGLCYSPEFVALGSVVRDMLHPDLVLIGESDRRAGDVLEELYRLVCDPMPPVRRMSFVNAELAKLAVNTFVTTKISYANMLSDICDRLPGADVDVVTAALGCDSRIGPGYLRGATAYGGPCFPRDNVAFGQLARALGSRADIAEATDRVNRYQVERILAVIRERVRPPARVGILGLAYKPHTPVVEESPGVALATRLLAEGYSVTAYDPLALPAARALLGDRIAPAPDAEACAAAADALVITTPWPEFGSLSVAALARNGSRSVIVDCWRILPRERFDGVADVVHLGRSGPSTGCQERSVERPRA